MGEHHFNPTAIAVKEGKIPPKKEPSRDGRSNKSLIQEAVAAKMGITSIDRIMGPNWKKY